MPFYMPNRPTFRVRSVDHDNAETIADHLQRAGQVVSPSSVVCAALAIAADHVRTASCDLRSVAVATMTLQMADGSPASITVDDAIKSLSRADQAAFADREGEDHGALVGRAWAGP